MCCVFGVVCVLFVFVGVLFDVCRRCLWVVGVWFVWCVFGLVCVCAIRLLWLFGGG